jgi:hypothetical protein
MNLFKRFLELVPGADPLLVGTVTAMTSTTSPWIRWRGAPSQCAVLG